MIRVTAGSELVGGVMYKKKGFVYLNTLQNNNFF